MHLTKHRPSWAATALPVYLMAACNAVGEEPVDRDPIDAVAIETAVDEPTQQAAVNADDSVSLAQAGRLERGELSYDALAVLERGSVEPLAAPFESNVELTVEVVGRGAVTLARDAECTSTCTWQIAAPQRVELTAAPADGYRLVGFSDGCRGGQIGLTQDTHCMVTFEPGAADGFVLRVTVRGEGWVSSKPRGLSCGSGCKATFPSGTEVDLVARPDNAGVSFAGWEGDTDCSDGSVASGASCVAVFEPVL